MNDGSDGNRTAGPANKPVRACERCGGAHIELPVLDTRNGRNYRLVRCSACDYLSWSQEP
jgi:hypothetical protein